MYKGYQDTGILSRGGYVDLRPPKTASWVRDIPSYKPGKAKEEIAKKYGIENPIKLASNENPLGPSPAALRAIDDYKSIVNLYPDTTSKELRTRAASFFKCKEEQIIAGNGSDEIIDLVCRAYIEPGDNVIIPECTFSYYSIASKTCGASVMYAPMKDGLGIDIDSIVSGVNAQTKIVFLANPNNPTGLYLDFDSLSRLLELLPDQVLVLLDEAYGLFSRAGDFKSGLEFISKDKRILVITTLSKSHGLAGLRIGFGIGDYSIIDSLNRIKPPFNVNILAQRAGIAALGDTLFLEKTLDTVWNGLDFLYSGLKSLGLEFLPSQTNFVLVKIGKNANSVYNELLRQGIITRYMESYGLREYIRISVGLPEENRALINTMRKILA